MFNIISRFTIFTGVTCCLIILFLSFGPEAQAGKSKTYVDVKPMQVSNPAMAKAFLKKDVRFQATFQQVMPGWGIGGLEKYHKSHVMVSMYDKDSNVTLPYVLVPADDPVLPTLKKDDLVTVMGKPKSIMDIYVAIIVDKLEVNK